VPVSLIATFSLLLLFNFSLNMLTLLALILSVGLVVDDAIVVLENIHRRMTTLGESALVAAYRGTRQVGFAVVATTLVLAAVFVPIAFVEGDLGRLFTEFAVTMSGSVLFSALVALTLCPVIAAKLLKPAAHNHKPTPLVRGVVLTRCGGCTNGYLRACCTGRGLPG
jgi:multidrug efflux pump